MSYQVLARKWRPRSFPEMVGQEHVLRALINALDNDRVHHAFLFTGTRGVGKTTIARILAKSLNCEEGVSSTPCGVCSACREIDEGRFIDLIEVDAASRTKVEDTRELLENVQYAPTRGRYKVYLIDEVHMLSNHSFNALLKTLEEPPPHVKFLLATTDPQKLPVTILSRCLQFSLKRLPLSQIAGHLEYLLREEGIACDLAALQHLARAADGSMRDALSLLDQAIAFGGGAVHEAEVAAMLGSISLDHVMHLLEGLATRDAGGLLASVAEVAEQSPDFDGLLAAVISALHRIALGQFAPEAIDDSLGDRDAILELGARIPPEDVQLYYQIGLLGRRDLPLAPDARGGFEMVLLRMLSFVPQAAAGQGQAPQPGPQTSRPTTTSNPTRATTTPTPVTTAQPRAPMPPAAAAPATSPIAMRGGRARAAAEAAGLSSAANTAPRSRTARDADTAASAPAPKAPLEEPEPVARIAAAQAIASPAEPAINVGAGTADGAASRQVPASDQGWARQLQQMNLSGVALQLASNCARVSAASDHVELMLDPSAENLLNPKTQQRLADAINEYAGTAVRLTIRVARVEQETPQQQQTRLQQEAMQAAVTALETDANVVAMKETFNAQLRMDSVQALDT